MHTWTLLRTLPTVASKYVDFINSTHPQIELYYPVYEALCRPHGHRRPMKILRPSFPGYIFARPNFNTDEPNFLVHGPYRVWFIKFGPEIEAIPDTVISQLKELELQGLLAPRTENQKNPNSIFRGQRVKVSLPTIDILGTVKRIMQIRVLIDTDLCEITVPLVRVAPYTP